MDDYVEVQIDNGGNWQTITRLPNNSQSIKIEMENIKRRDPERRVRCVDSSSRLIDLMY